MTALASGWTSELAQLRDSYATGMHDARRARPQWMPPLSATDPQARYYGWRSVQNTLANDIARCVDLGLQVNPATVALWRRACDRANDTAWRAAR